MGAEDYGNTNKGPNLFMTPGVTDGAVPDHGAITFDHGIGIILKRVDGKPDSLGAVVAVVGFESKGMKRGGSRPGVHFRLDVWNGQGGEGQPLAPAEDRMFRGSRAHRASYQRNPAIPKR